MVNHTQDFVAVKKYEILQYSLIPIDQGQCHQSIFKHAFAAMLLKLDVSKVVLTLPRGFKVAE